MRPAVPADAAPLARINRRARAAAMPWLREVRTEEEVRGWLEIVLIPRWRVLLVEGTALLAYVAFGTAEGQGTELLDLYVDPDWQRQGFGRALLRAAMEEAGEEPIALRCFTRNRVARDFYEGFGFEAASFQDGTDNEEGEPDVTYVRRPALAPCTRGTSQ